MKTSKAISADNNNFAVRTLYSTVLCTMPKLDATPSACVNLIRCVHLTGATPAGFQRLLAACWSRTNGPLAWKSHMSLQLE